MISDGPVRPNGVPSWWRIVCTDSALLVAFGFALMMIALAFFHWALYAFELMLPERADLEAPRLGEACVIAAVTSAPLLLPGLWWVFVTRRAFRSGTRVSGRIRKLSRARGTMLVEYDFKHNDDILVRTGLSTDNMRYRQLHSKQRVTVCFDPDQPKHSFICELYV